jgi:protein-disulfide isomerase
MSRRIACLFAAAAVSLSAAGCSRAQEDPAFGAKVRAYLLAHPEVLEEAFVKLQEKKDAAGAVKARAAIVANRQAIERDPRDYVANPNGAITITQFYDYRCPHCINVAPKVDALIKANPDLRFVFKELPIFGDVSEHASREAIALKRAGGDVLALYRDYMATRPLDKAAIDRIARNHQLDPDKVETGLAKADADKQLADVRSLAETLGIEGTPAFIVGEIMVPGEDMDALNAAIAEARKAKKAG